MPKAKKFQLKTAYLGAKKFSFLLLARVPYMYVLNFEKHFKVHENCKAYSGKFYRERDVLLGSFNLSKYISIYCLTLEWKRKNILLLLMNWRIFVFGIFRNVNRKIKFFAICGCK